jgi:cytidine deaminase
VTLAELAKKSRENSYSPYSKHKVGAAVRTRSGKVYGGCNVENSSYGGTVCAERVAIHKAVSEEGAISIDEVVVVTDATPPWPPCGMCRQVIAEFASNETRITTVNLQGESRTFAWQELLPMAFTPEHLTAK